MSRLIDADKLKKALNYMYDCAYIDSKSKEGIVSDVIETIDNAPAVEINTNDLEHKAYCKGLEDGKKITKLRGKWIELRSYDYKCSLCGNSMMDKWNYCPDCGAQMVEGDE